MKTLALALTAGMLAAACGTFAGPRVPATALAFSPDGKLLLVGGDREVRVCSVASGEAEPAIACEFPKISALVFSPDKSTLAVAGGTPGVSGGVLLVDWARRTLVAQLTNHTDLATAVAFDSRARRLATAGADGVVQVFDWPRRTATYRLEGHSGPVLAVLFSPDGELLVTASADRSIKVWEAGSGKLRRSFSHHTDVVHCLVLRPRATNASESVPFFCASGSQDKTVRIWQPGIGRMVRIIRGHDGPVFALASSNDGTRYYSAGQEGMVRVLDAESDQTMSAWRAHDDWIYAMTISPDGTVLATGDWAGWVKLWDIRGMPATLRREFR